jgi:hypothetical protein
VEVAERNLSQTINPTLCWKSDEQLAPQYEKWLVRRLCRKVVNNFLAIHAWLAGK